MALTAPLTAAPPPSLLTPDDEPTQRHNSDMSISTQLPPSRHLQHIPFASLFHDILFTELLLGNKMCKCNIQQAHINATVV